MIQRLLRLLFPPKCVVCRTLLKKEETDLCHRCRGDIPDFPKSKISFSFIAGWTAIWYYKDAVRSSILRFKFGGRRSYAGAYGRLLAMQLQKQALTDFDVLTWAPISARRRWKRGYDQCQLLADAMAAELDVRAVPTLKRVRHTPPQSTLASPAARRANVLGAYRVLTPNAIAGKRVLLLDDIITTGATVSECARVLLTAGAKEVICGAIAAAPHDKK